MHQCAHRAQPMWAFNLDTVYLRISDYALLDSFDLFVWSHLQNRLEVEHLHHLVNAPRFVYHIPVAPASVPFPPSELIESVKRNLAAA